MLGRTGPMGPVCPGAPVTAANAAAGAWKSPRAALYQKGMQPRVVMYRTPYCPYCSMAARLLQQLQLEFEEVDVSGDHVRRQWLLQESGQRTVPQIFINGRSVGGYDDLSALVRRGELAKLLALPPLPEPVPPGA